MKVLWFTNTPSLAANTLSEESVGGGWIMSLEAKLKKHNGIDLGVVFYTRKQLNPFEYKGTRYYSVFLKKQRS